MIMAGKRKAIFPGSFDPFTVGHESIVLRGLEVFDEIVVAVGVNSDKRCLFPVERRVEFIRAVFEHRPEVSVQTYDGLTVDFARQIGCGHIIRGLRTSADFEFERAIDTVFLLITPEHTPVNSTIVMDILRHGGDASLFLPRRIRDMVK